MGSAREASEPLDPRAESILRGALSIPQDVDLMAAVVERLGRVTGGASLTGDRAPDRELYPGLRLVTLAIRRLADPGFREQLRDGTVKVPTLAARLAFDAGHDEEQIVRLKPGADWLAAQMVSHFREHPGDLDPFEDD